MNLGIYGDGGSMRGSGINSIDKTLEVTCGNCRWEGDLDGQTDDSRETWYAECPNCKDEIIESLYEDPMFADPED